MRVLMITAILMAFYGLSQTMRGNVSLYTQGFEARLK